MYMNSTFELVFSDELASIFKTIANAFDMRMSVLDMGRKEMAPLQIQPISRYCQIVQSRLGLLKSCEANDSRYCTMALKNSLSVTYTCHAGLREAIFPIIIDGEPIGFFLIGQFATKDFIPSNILKCCRSPEEQKELKEAFSRIKTHKKESLESIIKLLEITTEHVIDKKLISIKRNMLSDKIFKLIKSDLKRNYGAEEAAKIVHKSLSTINKALNQTVGMGFKQYSAKIRLEEARRLLTEDPDIHITETAEKVGYQDPLYFSRIFKKEYSISPRAFRDSFRSKQK